MEFNIDEFKINGNKLYLSGWVHHDKYKIKVVSNDEEKIITKHLPRYDINMTFHEKIEENNYGFKEEIEFSKKIKVANIYLVLDNEETLIRKLDNRKLINILRKIKKFLGKIKRGLKFLWREYHFIVPPTMIKKYLKMIFSKKDTTRLYNPEIDSEYNDWLEKQSYSKEKVSKKEITIIDSEEKYQKLNNIKTKYVLIINGKVDLIEDFFSETKQATDDDYDLIYFDNDIVENNKFKKPILKPGWSIDTLLGVNYIGNSYLIKTELLKKLKIKEFNPYYYLLELRNKDIKVKHIEKILYHDYDGISNEKDTLKNYLKSENIDATVKTNPDKITNTVIYNLEDKPLISIIIPTKDHADILETCLKSIYEKSTYKNYEIIVIDNNSEEEETFELLKKYDKKENFRYKRIECEFNFSYLNNEAVKMSKGEYILLLNNDIEVISPNWLEIMLGYAKEDHIGTVGVKLIFPDETIQHAGIIMGKGGLAGHAHYGKRRNYISPQYELKIPYNYSASTAACLMVSKKKYQEVNGLEEKLKVAFNDVDFNLKLLDKGYKNIFLPNVELYHYESKSRGLDTTPEKQKRFIEEWAYMKEHWNKYIEHDDYYNDNFSKDKDYYIK